MPPIPPVTRNLMIACAVILVLQSFAPMLLAYFGLWPVASGNFLPWQVLTYAFLHGDIGHLFFNMLGLWMFGTELERLWGQRRYLQFLLASVLAAAAAQLLVNALMPGRGPTVGASGALFGLLLAYALAFRERRFDLVGFLPVLLLVWPNQLLNMLGLLLFFMLLTNRHAVPIPPMLVKGTTVVALYGGLELLLGMYVHSRVAHFAHLGGMVGGWLMLRYWRRLPPFGSRRR